MFWLKGLGLGYIMNCVCNQPIRLDKYHDYDIQDYHPNSEQDVQFEFDGENTMDNKNHSELDDYEIIKYVQRIVQFS